MGAYLKVRAVAAQEQEVRAVSVIVHAAGWPIGHRDCDARHRCEVDKQLVAAAGIGAQRLRRNASCRLNFLP